MMIVTTITELYSNNSNVTHSAHVDIVVITISVTVIIQR